MPGVNTQRSARRAAVVVLPAVAVTSWIACGLLVRLPSVDEHGRQLLHLWYGHSSTLWAAVAFAVAVLATFTSWTWLLVRMTRAAPARFRALATGVAVALWLASLAASALAGLFTLLVVAVEGPQTLVRGADRTAIVITSSSFDGDVDRVWRQVGPSTYAAEPGLPVVDPRSGPCDVVTRGLDIVVTCGSTSQTLAPEPPRRSR